MRPAIFLDGDAMRANVAAFEALGARVAAVVKNDGYGWGAGRLARELNEIVESYFVADVDELAALRPATAKPVRLLSDASPGDLPRVLDLNGIPNVGSHDALAEAIAAARRRGGLTVRVGILDAAGWSAIRPEDAPAFATAAAGNGLSVELWTHVTSAARGTAILDGFLAAERSFTAAGVTVAGRDVASTASARRELAFDRLRIGVGLFGSRLGAPVDNRCALRVVAPVVRRLGPGEVRWAGYGDTSVTRDASLFVLRCGYGDGFPKTLAGTADILSVGMQYTTRLASDGADARVLIGSTDDVDGLAVNAGITPHELVVGLAWR